MAFKRLKKEWRLFWSDRPGERFENRAQRMKDDVPRRRVFEAAVGTVAVAAGTAMLIVPGPGAITLGFGLALIAGSSVSMAKQLDRAETGIRRRIKPPSCEC